METSRATFGKFKGIVIENQDPERLGRLKVQVPGALGEELAWAMPCTPYAGPLSGFFMMPEPGTGVWIEFEEGEGDEPGETGENS